MHAYRLKFRQQSAEQYRHEQMLWVMIATQSTEKVPEPDVPDILRDS